MQQEATLDLALFDVVHKLLVFLSAKRGRDQRLRFTPRKQRRAVGARQPTYFAGDGANFGKTPAIGTASMVQNIVAKDLFFEMVESLSGPCPQLWLILRIALDDFFFQSINSGITGPLFLARGIKRGAQALGIVTLNLRDHLLVQYRWFDRSLLDCERFVEFFLPATEPVDLLVSKHQGLNHDRFGDFLRPGFDHHDRFFGSGDNQVQL